jgi:NTP pyrophosphatase (non-canonical NTP hydrolase)
MKTGRAMLLIEEEVARAKQKFPWWPEDTVHGAAIVAEESGELVQAALQHTYEGGSEAAMKREAIHTGAMAVRFLESLE